MIRSRYGLTLLHSEGPKLYGVLALLSAIGLKCTCMKSSRALDKRRYLTIIRDNFSYLSLKPLVVTHHLNRLDKTVQMRGHNI